MKIIILCLLGVTLADWYHNTKAVSLTAHNYQHHLGTEQHIVLDFFTPWCIYCQHMAPEYNKVFDHYSATRPDILIAKMNCDDGPNRDVCRSFGVNSFPTILFFPAGSHRPTSNFQNYRTYDHFVQWIDGLAVMSEETRLKQLEADRERLRLEQEAHEKALQEQLEKERQIQEEIELQFKHQQEQVMMAEKIQVQMDEMQKYMEGINQMNQEISELNNLAAEINTKINLTRKQGRVNWDHAAVFGGVGMVVGTLLTSCICMLHRRADLIANKAQ